MSVTLLSDFDEDDSVGEFSDDNEPPKPKRPRRETRIWLEKKRYDSREEAEAVVNDRKIWKISSSKWTPSGRRVEYRCTAAKYRVDECPAAIYLLYHATTSSVSLYETQCEHANHCTDPSRGLSTAMKLFIQEKYNDGITKPLAILNLIRQRKMVEPPKAQLVNYLKTIRQQKYGPPSISATDLRTRCQEMASIPNDADEPFVLAHHIDADSQLAEDQDLKIVFTTKRLLSIAEKSRTIQADATYKLLWQGYPVIIMGTSDIDNVFHPYVLAVTKGETVADFSFVFRALHQYNLEWKPNILLADACTAITNAFVAIFGVPEVRIMCHFHMLQNVEKYLKPLQTRTRLDLKLDIRALQTCADEETFMKASDLFLAKWRKKNDVCIKTFVDYFEGEWLRKNAAWYEGAARGCPSTNNGLEATNSWVKRNHTLRERLPVGQFVNSITDLVRQWSERRDPTSANCVQFAEVVTVPLKVWTSAYSWATENKDVLQRPHSTPGCTEYLLPSSTMKNKLTTKVLQQYEKKHLKWKSFDEFKEYNYGIWNVVVNPSDLAACSCTCPNFQKHSQCKHTVGMQIRLKLVQVPPAAKNFRLGCKRKRGRPALAKQALLIQ